MSAWEINFKENKQVWDAFVLTSQQRSIFVYTKFLDSLNANYDLVTCYEKSQIVAGAVLIFSDTGEPIDRPYPFTQFQGVLLADNASQSAHSQITHEFKIVEYFISQLTEYYKKGCFCHSWRLNDLRPFMWHNYHEPEKGQFKVELRYTGILDLKKYDNFDAYLSSVRSCRRQEFKKASQILELEFSDDEGILDSLHAMTFERQSIERSRQDSVLVRSICQHAVAGGYGKMSVALLDEVPVSAVLFLYDDRAAYYLFGANDPAYRNTGAGSFLILRMIKDAFENGIEEIDFVGVNSPSRGDYKISLNVELKSYLITTFNGGK
ncbi:MAG: GNAT family N-acetyltransferase [Methylobacter sp.]|nr:GNAT family N-acetyltransferase [Candidatus Methylobacter titanis]